MRLILGTALAAALAVTGAYAQGNTTQQVTGSKAFCLKMEGGKVNCGYDNLEACNKQLKGANAGTGSGSTCLPRSEIAR